MYNSAGIISQSDNIWHSVRTVALAPNESCVYKLFGQWNVCKVCKICRSIFDVNICHKGLVVQWILGISLGEWMADVDIYPHFYWFVCISAFIVCRSSSCAGEVREKGPSNWLRQLQGRLCSLIKQGIMGLVWGSYYRPLEESQGEYLFVFPLAAPLESSR